MSLNEDDDAALAGGAEEELPEGSEPAAEKSEEGDARLAAGGEEADVEIGEDGEIVPPAAKGGDPAARERPKKSSKQRRDERRAVERQIREERDFYMTQHAEVMQRLATVESTALTAHLSTVDSRLSECLNDAEQAERLELAAHEAKDTEGVLQARRIREKARSQANLLETEKQRLASLSAQRKTAPPRAPLPGATEIAQHAALFRADKPWIQFRPEDGAPLNAESAAALSIDNVLRNEGRLSERDPAYWQELERRVKAALPHKFQSAQTDDEEGDEDDDVVEQQVQIQPRQRVQQPAARVAAPGKKGPAVGSSGRQQNAGQTVQRLSPARVDALKELGYWDDPKLRKEWVDYYAKYDREHTGN